MVSGPLQTAGTALPQSFLSLAGEESAPTPGKLSASGVSSHERASKHRGLGKQDSPAEGHSWPVRGVVLCDTHLSLTWDRHRVSHFHVLSFRKEINFTQGRMNPILGNILLPQIQADPSGQGLAAWRICQCLPSHPLLGPSLGHFLSVRSLNCALRAPRRPRSRLSSSCGRHRERKQEGI